MELTEADLRKVCRKSDVRALMAIFDLVGAETYDLLIKRGCTTPEEMVDLLRVSVRDSPPPQQKTP